MKRAGWAPLLAVAVAVAGCGVKAPPRPPGGADKAPPHDLFKPTREPGPVAPEPITVGPQPPAAPPSGAAAAGAPAGPDAATPPAAPATPAPGQEPSR
jgi:hypothetical protein